MSYFPISRRRIVAIATPFIFVIIFAATPIVFVIYSAGDNWQGVFPDGYVGDSEFYMLRMVKGTQIFPFGNNPFFIEHIKDTNPALSIADYIAAVPLKAGLSLTATMLLNSIFWNVIFAGLLLLFLKQIGVKNDWIFYLMPVIYLEVYGAMIRPVVLQIVLPFFMFFLLRLAAWLRKQTIFHEMILAAGTAGTLYIYPYTWQITFSIFGLLFFWFLVNKQWFKAIAELKIIFLSLIIAFPAVFSIYEIASNPLFPSLLRNAGSIYTHIPSKLSFTLSRWVIVNSLLWYIVSRFTSLKNNNDFKLARLFLIIMGFAIFTVLMSPIITGRDGAIGDHVGRELLFWLSISTSVLAYFIFQRSDFYQKKFYKKLIIVILLTANFLPVLRHYKRSLLQPFNATQNESISVQEYAKPISWLDEYDKNPKVVWADEGMSGHVFTLSRHYAFDPPDVAYQYWITNQEMQERYLVSKYFIDITPQFLTSGFTVPLGHQYVRRLGDLEWKAELCRIFDFMLFGGCIPTSSGLTLSQVTALKNKETEDLVEKNKNEIRPYINDLLKKYKIVYAIRDIASGSNFHVEKIKNFKKIYNDGRFIVYKID